jgi:hypothetical protein
MRQVTEFSRQSNQVGYTVIELLVVFLIIGVLCATEIKMQQQHLYQSHIVQAIFFAKPVQDDMVEHYTYFGKWPVNEEELRHELTIKGAEGRVLGLKKMSLGSDGAIHIWLNEGANIPVDEPVLTLRPVLAGSPGPGLISWVCGDASVSDYTIVTGDNKTNIPPYYLPKHCQDNR